MSTHPLARSNWCNRLHASCNTVVVNDMSVMYSCCVLQGVKHVQKKSCLRDPKRAIFTICLSLQAKCEIPVFRVHLLARSLWCILSSRVLRDYPFPSRSPPCRFLCAAVVRVHNGVCASTVMRVCSLLLYRPYVRCCHSRLLCTRITRKCECFKILKMSLFLVLPVPTRKMWNSSISCTPTSALVGVQIFIHVGWKDDIDTLRLGMIM